MLYNDFVAKLAREFKATDLAKAYKLDDFHFPNKLVNELLCKLVDELLTFEGKDVLRLRNSKGKYALKIFMKKRAARDYTVAKKGGGKQVVHAPAKEYLTMKVHK